MIDMDEFVSVPFDTVVADKGPPARWSSDDLLAVPRLMTVLAANLDRIVDEFRGAGWLVYHLPPDIRDGPAFIKAMRELTPLSPPFSERHQDDPNWDALADSLSGGLQEETISDRIAIVWPTPREGASLELEEAMSVLAQVANNLKRPELTCDHPKHVLVLTTGHVSIAL